MKEQMRDVLIRAYLDYRNNYLTWANYGENNGLTENQAWELMQVARSVFESDHPEA